MHEHERKIRGYGGQRGADRLLAVRATGDDDHRRDVGEQRGDRVDVVGRRRDHHRADGGRRGDPADGVDEQRIATEQPQRLGTARAQPDTGASRSNEDRDVTARVELRSHVAVLGEEIQLERWL